MRAKDVMIENVIFINKEDKLDEIISVLMQNHVSGVPVIDKDNHLVGMVTEKDLVTKEKGLNISSYMEFMASILFIDGKLLRNVNKKKIGDEVLELLLELDATNEQLDSPMLFCSGRAGTASFSPEEPGTDLTPLFDTILEYDCKKTR